jgi:hypothetical protein
VHTAVVDLVALGECDTAEEGTILSKDESENGYLSLNKELRVHRKSYFENLNF